MKRGMIISIFMASGILLSSSLSAQNIFELIRKNKVDEIRKLIDKDPAVIKAVTKKHKETPLHKAVKQGRKQIVQLLLDKGADVNAKNGSGKTPLFLTSDKEIADLLIGKGANVNEKDIVGGYSPLHFVDDLAVAQLLIKKGANVNAKNEYGDTPLHSVKHADVAQLLIEKGADINAKNKYGATPLCDAIRSNCEGVVRVLLEKDAKYEGYEFVTGPALVETARVANVPIADALIKKGFKVDEEDDLGRTPLNIILSGERQPGLGLPALSAKEFLKALKPLIRKEIINVVDEKGNMPLHYAVELDDTAIVLALLANGAEINAQDLDGDTPLHLAAKKGLMNIVKFLVNKGADVTITNAEGKIAAFVTKKNDIRNFLLKKEKEAVKK